METLQTDYSEEQNIINLRLEVTEAEKKQRLRKERRSKKKIINRILSVAVILIVFAIVIVVIKALRESSKSLSKGTSLTITSNYSGKTSPFEGIYYYESDKQDRYEAYRSANGSG